MIGLEICKETIPITLEVKEYIGEANSNKDYENLYNKPQINGVTLEGNLTLKEVGIDIPTKLSEFINDSSFVTNDTESLNHYYNKKEIDEKISGTQNKALLFDTKDDLYTWIQDDINKSTLKIGQNIYIKEIDTPDYWWDGTELQILETEKVSLEGYVTETQLDTKLSEYVKNTDVETQDIDFSGYFS